jgi:protein disulfide-isomerase A4
VEGGQSEEVSATTTSKPAEENDVFVLTKDNFDDFINGNDVVLVEFYAPWCGHCKALTPEYEKAAKRLKAANPPVLLAKVDATVETDLGSRFEVSGYPTLKWFKSGMPYDYDGPREENGIVEFMREHSDPTWKPPPEAVIVLTKENFTEVTDREELIVVMFYAPWCGHCKRLKPEYEKAAQELKKLPAGPILLAKVDATVETDLAAKFQVSGYPTLKVFRRGKVYNYKNEAREKWGILRYVQSLRGSASKEVPLDGIWKQMSKSDDSAILVVGFFDAVTDKAFQIYDEATNEMREDYQFVHTFDPAAPQRFGVKSGSIVAFLSERFQSPYEPKSHTLDIKDDTPASDIVEFVGEHNAPLVGQYGRASRDKVYKERRPLVLFFYTVDWTFEHREATQGWRLKFAKIARDFPTLTFAIADEEENEDLFKEFGFDDSGEEVNVGIIGPKERKYAMQPQEEFDSDDVRSFIRRFMKGDAKPRIKSQPVPKKSSGPVTVVVGNTFEKIVLDKSKDVLIELYAPWCGHCKSLEPVYRDLAKRFKSVKRLVIAKMDATANDSPEPYTASGFPTIYFAPAGSKQSPVSYSGDRSLDDLIKFIRKHATVPLDSVKDEL